MIVGNSNLVLKFAIIGPQRVGKTVLSNSLSEYLNVIPPDYKPTAGCRILEVEKQFTEDQIKNTKYLKTNNISKCKIQIWDVSGDKNRYEKCWPAIQQDINGIIVVIDAKNNKYDNILDEWVNSFCKEMNLDNMMCFSYSRDEELKNEKPKVCKNKQYSNFKYIANQFPKLSIVEVTNDYNILLPHFNKFITKILNNMMP